MGISERKISNCWFCNKKAEYVIADIRPRYWHKDVIITALFMVCENHRKLAKANLKMDGKWLLT